MGSQTAKIVNRILKGEKVKNIKVEICDPKLIMNYNTYKKFDLKLDYKIKNKVKFINKPKSFLEKYSIAIIYTLIIIIAIFSILMAINYYNNLEKQKN